MRDHRHIHAPRNRKKPRRRDYFAALQVGEVMDKTKLPPNLHIIPYRQGIAEYAALVRKEIHERKDTDVVLAVDLPHGLEKEVMAAVKALPRASIVVDQLFRGIPVIPTSAPIEAVRSFQETGVDLKFIDTSLPVTGNLDDYRYFIDQCRLSGVTTVIKNAEYYGISPDDLLKSWIDTLQSGESDNGFCHLPERAAEICAAPFSDTCISPYLRTRLQYMALQLDKILENGTEVVLVCSLSHVAGIRHFLNTPHDPVDDSYIVPARVCAVGEEDILQISDEIPYFMYLYELYRDTPVDREKWITNAYCGTGGRMNTPDTLMRLHRYAYNLALTDKEIYPDIYNLVASAKYCATDDYAYEVYRLLKSYPPQKNIKSECSLLKIVDYNFQPLQSTRYLSLRVTVFNESPKVRRIRERLKRTSSFGYYRFTRSPQSLQDEREFMHYMTSRFVALRPSEENYLVHEFVSGFCDGLDIRETIRNKPFNRICVREQAGENRACYVLDYRGVAPDVQGNVPDEEKNVLSFMKAPDTQARFCSSRIFLDKNYPWVGFAAAYKNHYRCGVMVTFCGQSIDPVPLMDELIQSRPLQSAVQIGIRHAKQVFVFTDSPGEIEGTFPNERGIRVLPTGALPAPVFTKMHEFDIVCNRYDNRRGD